jgi:hypothetical protein
MSQNECTDHCFSTHKCIVTHRMTAENYEWTYTALPSTVIAVSATNNLRIPYFTRLSPQADCIFCEVQTWVLHKADNFRIPSLISSDWLRGTYKRCINHRSLKACCNGKQRTAVKHWLFGGVTRQVTRTNLQRAAKTSGIKGKVHPRTDREGPEGEQMYTSTLSLTSALDGGGWWKPRPRRFTPGRERDPCTHYIGGWVGL